MPSTPAALTPAALGPILRHLRAEPSRTWSIIITLYGDAIVSRGGSVWLGTVLEVFGALDISEGVVRTAMSRLCADGWLERRRVGRNSFYRLAAKGQAEFAEAARRIYQPPQPGFAGHFDMLLLPAGPEREAARPALEAAGCGSPSPGIWLLSPAAPMPIPNGILRLHASGEPDQLRALAARSWPLETIASAYHRFLASFTPLRATLEAGETLSDIEALAARLLLIHEYRRIVLRDPLLPDAVLPTDWPGAAARALCSGLYRQLLPGSERWLDDHALDENGAALPAGPEMADRFMA